jgi:IS5 family transposase
VAIDSTNLDAWANGHRTVTKDGPERERFADPDASWGHRSAISTRAAGSFYGYKLHAAVCAATGMPLAWRVETARRNDSLYSAPLLDALHARGFKPETCAMDKGYDNARVHSECEERGVHPVIPLRAVRGKQIVWPTCERASRLMPRIPRHTQRFRELYAGRGLSSASSAT